MTVSEKTLAELAQGATGIATLRVGDTWQKGIVFGTDNEKFFASVESETDEVVIWRCRILTNGVKVGNMFLVIPAAELRRLLGVENG